MFNRHKQENVLDTYELKLPMWAQRSRSVYVLAGNNVGQGGGFSQGEFSAGNVAVLTF